MVMDGQKSTMLIVNDDNDDDKAMAKSVDVTMLTDKQLSVVGVSNGIPPSTSPLTLESHVSENIAFTSINLQQ
jgi:hypothetical protein